MISILAFLSIPNLFSQGCEDSEDEGGTGGVKVIGYIQSQYEYHFEDIDATPDVLGTVAQNGTIIGAVAVGSDATTLDSGTALLFSAVRSLSFLKMTSDAELTATIAVDTIALGKIEIFVEYFI